MKPRVAPPKNGKTYTRRDLPLEVTCDCGCVVTIQRPPTGQDVTLGEMIADLASDYCFICEENDALTSLEATAGLRPLHRDPKLKHKHEVWARENRLNFFNDWKAATESELDSGIREHFNRKMLEVLEACAGDKKNRWKKPRLWIPRFTVEGAEIGCWHQLQLSCHIVQETLKDRAAFDCVVIDPDSLSAGHLKQAAALHVQTVQDALQLIASPSKDIRTLGIYLAGDFNNRKR